MDLTALRLLIVDDFTLFRQGLRALLADAPDLLVVGEAGDAATALSQARLLRPDVILLDLHLPDADGLEATATITRELPSVKVIVVASDNRDPALVYQAIRMGAVGYVSKQSPVAELIEAVRRVARGEAILAARSITALVGYLRELTDPGGTSRATPDDLSAREREVLGLVAQGYSNRDIGERLCVTESTVRAHLHHILEKLHLSNRVQAATFALGIRPGEANGSVPARSY